jgi:3-hydroxymyristoyl/3-hydroxydecanoyl-(acyl carrier protein) dehydratase
LLRDEGAPPGRFHGVEPIPVRIEQRVAGVELTAVVDVPANAPFFGDHFPRRPVFPATLLLDTQMRLALDLAREASDMQAAMPRAVRMTHVKMRSFIVPSQRLDIGVKLAPCENEMLRAMLSATTDGRTVASARLELARSAGDNDDAEAIDASVLASTAGAIT